MTASLLRRLRRLLGRQVWGIPQTSPGAGVAVADIRDEGRICPCCWREATCKDRFGWCCEYHSDPVTYFPPPRRAR